MAEILVQKLMKRPCITLDENSSIKNLVYTLNKNKVSNFSEKDKLQEGWINGGFFVIEPEFIDFIKDDNSILEKDPLEKACKIGQLMAYQHEGFWQCMDTLRDKEILEKKIKINEKV